MPLAWTCVASRSARLWRRRLCARRSRNPVALHKTGGGREASARCFVPHYRARSRYDDLSSLLQSQADCSRRSRPGIYEGRVAAGAREGGWRRRQGPRSIHSQAFRNDSLSWVLVLSKICRAIAMARAVKAQSPGISIPSGRKAGMVPALSCRRPLAPVGG